MPPVPTCPLRVSWHSRAGRWFGLDGPPAARTIAANVFMLPRLVLLLVGTAAAAVAADSERLLTTIAEVKGLAPENAGISQPVRVRGVITVSLGSRGGAFLQDETGGVYVAPIKGKPTYLRSGDWVECTGRTAAGQYAPMVTPERLEYLGRKEIPAAVGVNLDEFASGRHDAEWVETRGVVRTVIQKPNTRPELELSVGRERLRVQICDLRGSAPASLVDAEVRIAGVASGFFNRDRQLLMPVLFVPDWSHVVVTLAAAADPFSSELRSTTSLFRYAPNDRSGHRRKVRGTVTHYLPGKAIFLRDAAGALYIETNHITPLQLGDVVEAAGFPAVRQGAAYLQDSVFRVVGTTTLPPAIPADPVRIAQGLIRPSELISIDGSLVETRIGRDRWMLGLKAGEQTFEVQVEMSEAGAAPVAPEVGSRLRVAGILWTEDIDPKSRHIVPTLFRVLSRSPADIAILQKPSWWTRARLAQAALLLVVVVVAAVVWIWLLRRRVESQTSLIAEKVAREAVAEERARTACEIHDTLAQGFMGLGFQLEALSSELKEPSGPARQHLDRAMKMLRHSHDDVRYSLKQLRGPAAERKPLGAALRDAVERGAPNPPPEHVDFVERGESFPLLPVTEHNMLRIGQEAATNAVKHARARKIEIELGYSPSDVRLRITDDGCGFDPAQAGARADEHFGLHIMRERAQRIGGRLEIQSRPGEGTQVLLTVPRGESRPAGQNGRHRP